MRRVGVVLLAVVLGGCSASTSAGGPDDAAATTPAWEDMSLEETRKAREVSSREAQLQTKACLEEQGFPSTLMPDGTLTIQFGDQRVAVEAAMELCQQQVDYGAADEPLTDEELRWLYDETVKAYECLEAQGYTPAEPQTFEVFVDRYRNPSGELPWLPHAPEGVAGGLPDTVCEQPSL